MLKMFAKNERTERKGQEEVMLENEVKRRNIKRENNQGCMLGI